MSIKRVRIEMESHHLYLRNYHLSGLHIYGHPLFSSMFKGESDGLVLRLLTATTNLKLDRGYKKEEGWVVDIWGTPDSRHPKDPKATPGRAVYATLTFPTLPENSLPSFLQDELHGLIDIFFLPNIAGRLYKSSK